MRQLNSARLFEKGWGVGTVDNLYPYEHKQGIGHIRQSKVVPCRIRSSNASLLSLVCTLDK